MIWRSHSRIPFLTFESRRLRQGRFCEQFMPSLQHWRSYSDRRFRGPNPLIVLVSGSRLRRLNFQPHHPDVAWAQRMITASPHATTNNKHNNCNDNTKYIMPNINNAKSSKSLNSDIANSPSDMQGAGGANRVHPLAYSFTSRLSRTTSERLNAGRRNRSPSSPAPSSGFPRDHTAVPRLCRASEGLDREKRHRLDRELCLRLVRFARCSVHLGTTRAPCAGLSARRLAIANEAINQVGSVPPEGPGL